MYAMKKTTIPSVVVVVLLAIAVIAQAQQPKKLNRVGYLKLRAGPEDNGLAFQQHLRELGYIEGQTIAIEWRFADGKSARFPLLAAELVKIGVEAIVTNAGDEPILAAMKATKTIPRSYLKLVLTRLHADSWLVWGTRRGISPE
jgi:putative ABC transport system substrate-binding protein